MIDESEVDDFLSHFGVKGMHWGVRHEPTPGVSRKVNRMAAKDAHEHARAKLFFGEGAGNRRKLINAKVEFNKKHISGYAKAFDNHSNKQNLSSHSTKAVKERHSIDRKDRNKKRVGAVARRITNEPGTQAAFVGLAIGGAAFLRSPKGQRFLKSGASKARSAKAEFVRRQGARRVANLIKKMK